jgi:hypothetical protein
MSPTAGADAGSPRPAWALSDAPISRVVKKRILSVLNNDFGSDDRFSMGDSTVSFVNLNAAGRTSIWITGPDGSCGATGNCPVWIFDRRTGAALVSDDGWDYGLRKTMHHGVYDFYMRANMSCCTGTLHEYRFDGKVYKLARSVDETTL